MKPKTERRLEDLEADLETPRTVVTRIREPDGTLRNMDGTPYVEVPLPEGARVIEIGIVDPPNGPPQLGPAVDSQVRH